MKREQFPTIINGKTYKFLVWGSENMWSANAYDLDLKCVAFVDGKGSDDVILELVKKIETWKIRTNSFLSTPPQERESLTG